MHVILDLEKHIPGFQRFPRSFSCTTCMIKWSLPAWTDLELAASAGAASPACVRSTGLTTRRGWISLLPYPPFLPRRFCLIGMVSCSVLHEGEICWINVELAGETAEL